VADEGIDKYLIDDIDDEMLDETEDEAVAPIIVPEVTQSATSSAAQPPAAPTPQPAAAAVAPHADIAEPAAAVPGSGPGTESAPATRAVPSREGRLADALERLMQESVDVEASALVSLDGFMIASALPQGMQEDRVGAMSAAILALGERAAAELGRGQLTQVFIEGAEGYVLLVAAGGRAVLTVLARKEAKLGLVLYDMKAAADTIAEILR
jgi:uncharacterized protein